MVARVAIIPAYQAAGTVGGVVAGLLAGFDEVWVLDDGSTDGTAEAARAAGARVFRHGDNRGKGAALRTMLERAAAEGLDAVVSVDADGQHPPEEAIRLDREADDRGALVLGVRDLIEAGAPQANRRGNRIANYWLAGFAGRPLRDTQCGLRRYPVAATLGLGAQGARFSFESEIVLRAVLRGMPVVEVPVRVLYPEGRTTHFRNVADPVRIIRTTIGALVDERGGAWFLREFVRLARRKR